MYLSALNAVLFICIIYGAAFIAFTVDLYVCQSLSINNFMLNYFEHENMVITFTKFIRDQNCVCKI